MTTKMMTPTLGPKIKTALPGPNAKRVLGATRNSFRRPIPGPIRWLPSKGGELLSPTSTATNSSIFPQASP